MCEHAVTFECVSVHTYVPVWKSEINIKYLPQSLSTLIPETEALTEAEFQRFG